MPEIKKALVTAYLKPENQERLKAALEPAEVTFCIPYGPDAKEKIAQAAQEADVCILNGDLNDSILAGEQYQVDTLLPRRTGSFCPPGGI